MSKPSRTVQPSCASLVLEVGGKDLPHTASRAILNIFPPFFFRLSIVDRFEKMGVDNLSKVRNKIKRQELYRNSKIEKSKSKITQRKERAQAEKLDPKLKEAQPLKIFSIQG